MVEQMRRRLDGKPLKPFEYRDFGSLVSLGDYSTVGNLMGFSRSAAGCSSRGIWRRLMYRSLYAMHQAALHGHAGRRLWRLLAGNIVSRRPEPGVKLH